MRRGKGHAVTHRILYRYDRLLYSRFGYAKKLLLFLAFIHEGERVLLIRLGLAFPSKVASVRLDYLRVLNRD